MKRRMVVIEEQAALDLQAHARWIAQHASADAAARWVDEMEQAFASLESMAERYPLAEEASAFGLPIRQMVKHGCRVLFVTADRAVHVLHVRHGAMLRLGHDGARDAGKPRSR